MASLPNGSEQSSLDSVCRGAGPASSREGIGDPPGPIHPCHRLMDLAPEPIRPQTTGGQPRAGAGHLRTPCDLELIPAEGDDADRDAVRQGLLGGAHAAVGNGANRPVE